MIFLLGVPGSGKSTQAKLLAEKLGCQWLSVGQLLRQRLHGKPKHQMAEGEILSDSVVLPILDEELKNQGVADKELVLDGSLRKIGEVDWLKDSLKAGKFKLTAIINIDMPLTAAQARLAGRGRPDDAPEAVAERFDEYQQQTLPVLEYLKEQGFTIHEIDGDQSEEAVLNDILKVVNAS